MSLLDQAIRSRLHLWQPACALLGPGLVAAREEVNGQAEQQSQLCQHKLVQHQADQQQQQAAAVDCLTSRPLGLGLFGEQPCHCALAGGVAAQVASKVGGLSWVQSAVRLVRISHLVICSMSELC